MSIYAAVPICEEAESAASLCRLKPGLLLKTGACLQTECASGHPLERVPEEQLTFFFIISLIVRQSGPHVRDTHPSTR